jgi:hypothetical protein
MCSNESLKNNNIEMLGFNSIEALRITTTHNNEVLKNSGNEV